MTYYPGVLQAVIEIETIGATSVCLPGDADVLVRLRLFRCRLGHAVMRALRPWTRHTPTHKTPTMVTKKKQETKKVIKKKSHHHPKHNCTTVCTHAVPPADDRGTPLFLTTINVLTNTAPGGKPARNRRWPTTKKDATNNNKKAVMAYCFNGPQMLRYTLLLVYPKSQTPFPTNARGGGGAHQRTNHR